MHGINNIKSIFLSSSGQRNAIVIVGEKALGYDAECKPSYPASQKGRN
jgi:hypothetical protein